MDQQPSNDVLLQSLFGSAAPSPKPALVAAPASASPVSYEGNAAVDAKALLSQVSTMFAVLSDKLDRLADKVDRLEQRMNTVANSNNAAHQNIPNPNAALPPPPPSYQSVAHLPFAPFAPSVNAAAVANNNAVAQPAASAPYPSVSPDSNVLPPPPPSFYGGLGAQQQHHAASVYPGVAAASNMPPPSSSSAANVVPNASDGRVVIHKGKYYWVPGKKN